MRVKVVIFYIFSLQIKQGVKDEDTLMLAAWALQSLAQAYMTEGTQENKIDRANIAIAAEYEHEALAYVSEAVGQDSHQVPLDS